MPRAVLADPVAARRAILDLGADALEDGLDERPRRRRAARHHGRPLERALFAAGHARADVQQALGLHELRAADRVGEVRVAAVDDDVAGLQHLEEIIDHSVDGRAGLYHQEHLARLLQVGGELFERVAADYVLALGAACREGVDLLDRAVVRRDGESLGLHVHDKVLAHDGKTHETDICFFHSFIFLVRG